MPTTRAGLFSRDFRLIWLTSFAGSLSFFLIQQPTLPLYVEHLGGGAAAIGWVTGAFSLTTLVFRPFVGRAVDTVGRRVLVLAGAAVFALCAPLYAVATSITLLILLRMVHGAGMALFTTSSTTYATDLAPPERRAELISYFGIGNNLAVGLGPLAASLMIAAGVGYQTVFLIAGAVAVVAVLAMVQARESPHVRTRDAGWSFDSLISRRALPPAGVMLTVSYSYGALATFLAVSAADAVLPSGMNAWFWLVYAATLIVVRLFSGRLADRFGRAATIVPGMAGIALSMLLVATLHSVAGLLCAAVLYAAGFACAYPALLALTVDRVGDARRGVAMATFSVSFDVGIGIGAVLSGLFVRAFGYPGMYTVAAAAPLLGLAGFAALVRHDSQRQAPEEAR